MAELYGGIEAGGTKFVCAVGSGPDDIRAETRFPTTIPEETLGRSIEFFLEQQEKLERLEAIGIAAFGPVDLNPDSPTYGQITKTPKPAWSWANLLGTIAQGLNVPVHMDTDVNVAALGEGRWGAAQGLKDFVYLTIGTGIGGGAMVNGRLVHGLVHPEMGHVRLPHDRQRDPFPGSCPFHEDCLEGLANGPAIQKRWGVRGDQLPVDHPAWELEAHYLALGVVNLICTLSPQRIILGGGVMDQRQLFPMIRREVQSLLAGYVYHADILEGIDEYIVPPGLGSRSGMLGAIALAMQA